MYVTKNHEMYKQLIKNVYHNEEEVIFIILLLMEE